MTSRGTRASAVLGAIALVAAAVATYYKEYVFQERFDSGFSSSVHGSELVLRANLGQ